MTKEEAIKYLIKPVATSTKIGEEKQKEFEAYNMAIEALSADRPQGVGRYENAMQKLREMPKYLNGVRVKQIKKISADRPSNVLQEKNPTPIEDYMTGKSRLADRPSGEWIKHEIEDTLRWQECSLCHKEYPNMTMNYCPNCGARMKGGNSE